jgi:uncharacterized protein (DUF433 family)
MTFSLIQSNPGVMLGKPVFAGTRIAIDTVLEFLGSGSTIDQIIADYPSLTKEHILEAIRFSSYLIRNEELIYA